VEGAYAQRASPASMHLIHRALVYALLGKGANCYGSLIYMQSRSNI